MVGCRLGIRLASATVYFISFKIKCVFGWSVIGLFYCSTHPPSPPPSHLLPTKYFRSSPAHLRPEYSRLQGEGRTPHCGKTTSAGSRGGDTKPLLSQLITMFSHDLVLHVHEGGSGGEGAEEDFLI